MLWRLHLNVFFGSSWLEENHDEPVGRSGDHCQNTAHCADHEHRFQQLNRNCDEGIQSVRNISRKGGSGILSLSLGAWMTSLGALSVALASETVVRVQAQLPSFFVSQAAWKAVRGGTEAKHVSV